jgi:hypothetical protein
MDYFHSQIDNESSFEVKLLNLKDLKHSIPSIREEYQRREVGTPFLCVCVCVFFFFALLSFTHFLSLLSLSISLPLYHSLTRPLTHCVCLCLCLYYC